MTFGIMRRLGAHDVIDYGSHNFLEYGHDWDMVADVVAASNFTACQAILKEDGRYLSIAGGLSDMFAGRRGTKRSLAGPARSTLADLDTLVELARIGAFRPAIGQVVAFDEMQEAHKLVDSGHKVGSVVVRVHDD
jgi:NADPH:quinone reductase-like Zn-dependent oxidoreductase